MKLIVTAFVTMNGVMQGPGNVDEDPGGGFEHGGWVVPFADPDMGATVTAWFERADEILLGRRTYEIFAAYWPSVTDPNDVVARQLNTLPKHVVSRTLSSVEWQHAALIDGDVVEAVKELKAKPGRELQVHGSAQLVQTLIEHDLVDEYRLLVFPVTVGEGKRLFGTGTLPMKFETVECHTTSAGVVALTLRPAGKLSTGEFAFEVKDGVGTHMELTGGGQ